MQPYTANELLNFVLKPGFQYYADYDEDDEDDFRPGALPVFGERSPAEGPPMDGEQYLKTVRWETSRVPGIVVSPLNWRNWADKQTANYHIPTPVQPATPGTEAPNTWEKVFLEEFDTLVQEFEELRKKAEEISLPPLPKPLPSIRDESYWHRFCFGKRPPKKEDKSAVENHKEEVEEQKEEKEDGELEEGELKMEVEVPQLESMEEEKLTEDQSGYLPSLSILLRLDAVGVQRLLWWQAEWLVSLGRVTKERAMWLFALLARTPKPIDADTAFHIREILRIASKQRSQLKAEDSHLLPSLNILITLAARYYGQKEPDQ